MFTLKLMAYSDKEIDALIKKFKSISPKNPIRCACKNYQICPMRHLCFDIDYALRFLIKNNGGETK